MGRGFADLRACPAPPLFGQSRQWREDLNDPLRSNDCDRIEYVNEQAESHRHAPLSCHQTPHLNLTKPLPSVRSFSAMHGR